jgi:hypothetical protein
MFVLLHLLGWANRRLRWKPWRGQWARRVSPRSPGGFRCWSPGVASCSGHACRVLQEDEHAINALSFPVVGQMARRNLKDATRQAGCSPVVRSTAAPVWARVHGSRPWPVRGRSSRAGQAGQPQRHRDLRAQEIMRCDFAAHHRAPAVP